MQRPSDVRTSFYISPYRYGDQKWEDYLLDTQSLIYDGAREQVKAVERVGQQAAERHNQQFILLEDFIADAGAAWERVSGQLDTLTDQLVTGFSALSHQLNYHAGLLEEIVDQLDHVAKSIDHPLATQANELVRSGEHLVERGLYREAFNDFTLAETKRSVNPLLHLHLAQLHYQVREDGIPFDYSAAESHLNLSIRYAKSLRADLGKDGAAVVDLVFRTGAHLALVKGGDLSKAEGSEAGAGELSRADGYLCQIDQPSPSSQFLHAQVLALQERPDESLAKVRTLADSSRSWIPRALLDPNLATIGDGVRRLSEDLKTNPEVRSQGVYAAIDAARSFTTRCTSIAKEFSPPAATLNVHVNEIERDFEAGAIDAVSAEQQLKDELKSAINTTHALILAAVTDLDSNRRSLESIAEGHVRRALKTWTLGGLLLTLFDKEWLENWAVFSGGCVLGFLVLIPLSMLPWELARSAAFAGSIDLLGGVLVTLFYANFEYQSTVISRADAVKEAASATNARAQANLLERRIDQLNRMRTTLML